MLTGAATTDRGIQIINKEHRMRIAPRAEKRAKDTKRLRFLIDVFKSPAQRLDRKVDEGA